MARWALSDLEAGFAIEHRRDPGRFVSKARYTGLSTRSLRRVLVFPTRDAASYVMSCAGIPGTTWRITPFPPTVRGD